MSSAVTYGVLIPNIYEAMEHVCAKHLQKLSVHLHIWSLQHLYKVVSVIIPILQMRKLSHREVRLPYFPRVTLK